MGTAFFEQKKIQIIPCKHPQMTDIQTLTLAHLPPDILVHVALYENLRNAPFLRQQLLEGNSEYEYALIDASVVSL